MMIQKALLAGAAAMLTLTSTAAEASDRYAQRPPVLVSPDLSAPWVMQLRGTATRRSGVVAEQPRILKRRSGESGLRHYVLPGKPDPMRTAAVPKPVKRAAPQMDPRFLPQQVEYGGPEKAGT
ncbi:MAG: L,D-transpeptidase, partial [Rhizobiaceae bacterium]